MNKKIFIGLVIVSLAVGFAAGFYFKYQSTTFPILGNLINRDGGKAKDVDFQLFWQAWDTVHSRYVDKTKIDDQELLYGAIDGMVKAVSDPYTVFLKPKDSENFAQEIKGTFGGIGIEIGIRNNLLTVIAPLADTPAAKAGLLAGDKIVKISDKSTESMKLNEAVQLIRGPKGTPVRLTIDRPSFKTPKEFPIIRDTIKVPTATLELLDGNIAYLELHVFNKNVDSDFKKITKEIVNSKADRIILDLRNNPGGLLDSAVNIASYFLNNGETVLVEKFADGRENNLLASANGQLKNYPLVILTNKGSASASEILAGALKDNRGILIVGEKSFGKGSVQEVIDLPDKSSIKVTIAKWFTPKGVSINDNGIEPDVTVERSEDDINNSRDPQLDKAKEAIRALK